MIPPELPGLLGVFVLLITICVIALIVLATFIIAIYQANYGGKKHYKRRVLQLLIASLIILTIDILCFYYYVSDIGGEPYLTGNDLDDFSIFVWLPIHILLGVLIFISIWVFNRKNKSS